MDAKLAYLKGLYKEAAEAKKSISTIGYKIGGLVFTAHHQEARILFENHFDEMSPESQIIASFHIGLSYTRTSDYDKAQNLFLKNLLKLRSKELNGVAAFFACQGVSFYRYFFSQNKRSQRFALRGYASLMKLTEPPSLLLALSLDIQGHNLIQLGRINLGLKTLEQALLITKKNNLKQLHDEIEITKYLYKSEYDDDLREQINNLKSLLKRTDNENDYSTSQIVIQIAKLYFLSGDFLEANQFLANNFNFIYKNENKRKVAKVNTLLAQLMIVRGQFLEALSIINVAERNLDEKTDFSLILPILGLKSKILSFMDQSTTDIENKIKTLLIRVDRQINHKIQNRINETDLQSEVGDDLLGDLFDLVAKKSPSSLKTILEKNFLSLIPIYFSIKPGSQRILISESQESVITIDHDKISLIKKNMTKTQMLILAKLTSHGISKEDLVREVWGYEYDSIRHDSLVYTAMARIRKNLGDRGHWILADEQRYYLASQIQIQFEVSPPSPINNQNEPQQKREFSNLNYRQLQTLADAPDKAFSVSEYGLLWGVTRMTALRDLKTLVKKKLVHKMGIGKATRYFLK